MQPTAPQIASQVPSTEVPSTELELTLPRNTWYNPRSFEIANWILNHTPRESSRALAAGFGTLGYYLCKHRRRAILGNLEAITPDKKRLHALAKANFENFLRMLHDFCDCASGGNPKVSALMSERRGFEYLEVGRQHGKGTLLITGHLGAWELGGMALASDGFPVSVVTLEEPTAELNAWRKKYRDRFGIKTITIGSDKFAFVEIIQALRRNELVAMLVDRPYMSSGVEVKFFGRPTLFSAAAVRIWQHTQASIIPAFVLQLERGQYGCYAYPPIEMSANRSVEENSQRIADVFQAIVREYPEQWFNFVPIWHR
jgi:Kdo2-lipid IVA lauroyltransferase/acyltransferase